METETCYFENLTQCSPTIRMEHQHLGALIDVFSDVALGMFDVQHLPFFSLINCFVVNFTLILNFVSKINTQHQNDLIKYFFKLIYSLNFFDIFVDLIK